MKKILIILAGLVILLCILFNSRTAQERADALMKSNEAHQKQVLEDFLSQP
jgi:hypothetical protein